MVAFGGRIIKYSGKNTMSSKNTPIAHKTGEELPRLLASLYTHAATINGIAKTTNSKLNPPACYPNHFNWLRCSDIH